MKLRINYSGDVYLFGEGFSGYWLCNDGTLTDNVIEAGKSLTERKEKNLKAQDLIDSWLPQEDWITEQQVIDSSKNPEMAFCCSLNHWKQIIMKWEDYFEASSCGKVSTHWDYCSLCKRHLSDGTCPLQYHCKGHCVSEWSDFQAHKSLDNAIDMFNKLQTTYNSLYRKDSYLKEKRFYIGELFNDYWRLCSFWNGGERYVVLFGLKGDAKYKPRIIPIMQDKNGKEYVTKLPTMFPHDFGLSKEYGV